MADRILKNDVRKAFESFTTTASGMGFDIRGWTLTSPDIGAPWELCKMSHGEGNGYFKSSTEFPRYVGSSNREAYDRLTSWSQAMHAVTILEYNRGIEQR